MHLSQLRHYLPNLVFSSWKGFLKNNYWIYDTIQHYLRHFYFLQSSVREVFRFLRGFFSKKKNWTVGNKSASFVSEIIKMSTLVLTIRDHVSNLFQIDFILKWPIINLSGYLDFISWCPTLALVKLLFEQPDSDLDSLLHKTYETVSLLLSKTFSLSKIKTESDNLVVFLKNCYYKECTKLFTTISLPEFVKCKPSFQSFSVVMLLLSTTWWADVWRVFRGALFTSFISSRFTKAVHFCSK